jgi:hypothetical protein
MYSFPSRQYDMVRTSNHTVTLPQAIPYRLNATDYIFFNYPPDFPLNKYRVIMESMSNASSHHNDRFRDIGPLEKKCELPDVYFSRGLGTAGSILVLPTEPNLPSFIGNLIRGATYNIEPKAPIITPAGHKALERTGGFY